MQTRSNRYHILPFSLVFGSYFWPHSVLVLTPILNLKLNLLSKSKQYRYYTVYFGSIFGFVLLAILDYGTNIGVIDSISASNSP